MALTNVTEGVSAPAVTPTAAPAPVVYSLPDSPVYSAVSAGKPDGLGYVDLQRPDGGWMSIHRDSFLSATDPAAITTTRNPLIPTRMADTQADLHRSYNYNQETPLFDIVKVTGDQVLGENTLGPAYTASMFGRPNVPGQNNDTGVGSPTPTPPEFVPAGADTGVVSTGPDGAAPTTIKEAVAATPGAPKAVVPGGTNLVLSDGSVDDFTPSAAIEEAAKTPVTAEGSFAKRQADLLNSIDSTTPAGKALRASVTLAKTDADLAKPEAQIAAQKLVSEQESALYAQFGLTKESVTLKDIPDLLVAASSGSMDKAVVGAVTQLRNKLVSEQQGGFVKQVQAQGEIANANFNRAATGFDPRYRERMESERLSLVRELNTLASDPEVSQRSVMEAQNKVAAFDSKLKAASTTVVHEDWFKNTKGDGSTSWNTGNVMMSFSMGFGALGLLAQYDAQNKQFDLQMKQLSEEREFRERQLKMQLIAQNRQVKMETGAMVEAASVGKPSNSGADAPSRNPEVRL